MNLFSSVVFKGLLILAIVLQSLTVVASATNENHQLDIEHVQTQHDHHLDQTKSGKLIDAEGHDVDDCHHCGHCSGTHLTWILVKNIYTHQAPPALNTIPYDVIQSKEFSEAILRPPIS
ncbi:hypothetical protein KO502_15815 [Colwellia sp. E2M01]|nr:hypothetical protein [Colwellia sp. E2M01]